ncbi:helix-turn-helix domain-containing protein [Actinokineospora inagensis]|uniref:helix-turn-helix domain-containing protein n=1 Tax=Actinokineospora inagensis TaxID=103730 RepID=UPI00041BE3F9|nr:helix-turn-helix transcriptional regulator [Actinokineospora inagensis]
MPERNELGEFLRARRSRVRPADIGLASSSGLRRTPGLRREELATMAGISVDYYVRLEQGRERNPSPPVLEALSRVLRLDQEAHGHLIDIAARAQSGARTRATPLPEREVVRDEVLTLLRTLEPLPVYLLNSVNDVLASNTAGQVLLAGMEDWPAEKRNTSRYVFLHPNAEQVFPHWDDIAWGTVAHLRAAHGTAPDDPRLVALVAELSAASAEFRGLWRQHEVKRRTTGVKVIEHPVVGRMSLTFETLAVSETDERLVVYQAQPGTADYESMIRLNTVAKRLAVGA